MIEDLQSRIQEQSEKSAKSESTQTMSEPDRKPFGYWRDIDNVVRELQAEMQRRGLTTVPTYGYLVSIGRSDLQAGMAKYHKIGDIRKLVGDQSPGMKEAGYWKDKKNILAHAKALQAQGFDFQNLNKLRDGNSVLRYAIQHYPGGQDNFFIDMGITYNPSNRVKWKTQEELVATLQTYKKENGLQRLPHARILAEKIDRKIEHAINKFGGMTTLRKLVGDTPKFDGHTYNTPESLKAFAQYILQKHGRTTLPTQSELKDLGYSGFIFAVTSNGGLNKLRKSLGETSCHGDKDWTNEEFIINQAREIMAAQNVTKLPAPQRLRELGYSAFSAAIDKYHGGYVCFRRKLGETDVRQSPGTWASLEFTINEAKKVMQAHGVSILPSQTFLIKNGYQPLNTAIHTYHGGFSKFRAALGETDFKVMGIWKSLEYTIEQAKKIMHDENLSDFPGQHVLANLGYKKISAAINKNHGGFRVFRPKLYAALGREPQSDSPPAKAPSLPDLTDVLQTYVGGA